MLYVCDLDVHIIFSKFAPWSFEWESGYFLVDSYTDIETRQSWLILENLIYNFATEIFLVQFEQVYGY